VQTHGDGIRFIHNQKTAQSAENRAGFDMTDMTPLAAMLRLEDMGLPEGPAALAPSSRILTLDGALPVEHLYPGDKLITRHGARALAAIDRIMLTAGTPIVEVTRNAFGGRPERDVWLPASQRILIRDWRAKALYGQAQACVPAGQLVDGDFVRFATLQHDVTCYALRFGRPEVLYADGLELASADRLTTPA
jgi:hypothetical protein